MSESVSHSWEELADAAMIRMLGWNLPLNERLIVGWIVELTYRRRRDQVRMPTQGHFAKLTGLDEAAVSRALKGLESAGVLQIAGPRNAAKYYRLLPNGRLVEPEPVADAAAVRAALAEIEAVNVLGPGSEAPGAGGASQRKLAIVTTEEHLALEQAAASRELAVDGTRLLRSGGMENGKWKMENSARDLVKTARRPGTEWVGILRKSQEAPALENGAKDAGAYARARNVTSNHCTNHVRDVDVRDGTDVGDAAEEGNDERFALEELKKLVDPAEFVAWERKWVQRCRKEPLLVLEAIGDTKELARAQTIGNWGKAIFRRAQSLAAALGREFRIFGL